MAFMLARPPSPQSRGEHNQIALGEEYIVPTHGNSTPSSQLATSSIEHDMGKDKPHLEIILDSQCLYLKGTGIDVEPTRLSGHVALYLAEATSIKEITLQFRGKARLPVPPNERLVSRSFLYALLLTKLTISMPLNAPLTYIVCSHEWSFLEGEKKHSRTLKAGRHFFPFQLQIGGSLPSSIFNSACGASVAYKLRAQASRPGLSSNFQIAIPVYIIRSFAPEALEYQQTLEIENTWPEKLMYSIMIPHKAWAAGDKLTALVKFSPIAKGVCVLSVTTTINETTKVYARSGAQEQTRAVATTRHEIINGKAVEVETNKRRHSRSSGHSASPMTTTPPINARSSRPPSPHSLTASGIATTHSSPHIPPQAGPSGPHSPHDQGTPESEESEQGQDDVVTYLTLLIPLAVTPSHTLEPIIVSHRIRWQILILNLDGHTSELRCSLPLHLLDHHLLEEARSLTAATRRLLIGGSEVPPEDEEDSELPSYTAHVRDRVANMFLPEAATMRVTNPWVSNGASPTIVEDRPVWPGHHSGTSTPLEAHLLSHLPHAPGSHDSTPLDWVNSELLLSLSEDAPPPLHRSRRRRSSERNPDSDPTSATQSRPSSRSGSLRPSRTTSLERSDRITPPVAGPNETYLHTNHASRNIHSLLQASMKPFTSLSHHGWLSRTNSHSSLPTMTSPAEQRQQQQQHLRSVNVPHHDPNSGSALLHRAFTEVPDYSIASRGFIGGVPPLESMRGLPSYDEVERTQSDSDLATRFARTHPVRAPYNSVPSTPTTS